MTNRFVIAFACVALVAAGCSRNQQQATAPGESASPAVVANTTDLPLYEGATVIHAGQFQQTLDPSKDPTSPFSSLGRGTYNGNTVVASSPAAVADLQKWLDQLRTSPPSGYRTVPMPSSVQSIARRYGIDFVPFVSGSTRGAFIVVMDPKVVTVRLGPVLRVLDQYNSLPAPLKRGMDSSIQRRTGWTISELTDQSAPVGAAIAAMSRFKDSNERAIVLVNAQRAL